MREALQGRGGRAHDRGTRVLIAISIGVTIAAGSAAASLAPALRMPGAARAAGVVVLWLGLAVRVWAVAALGTAFRTTVEVEAGQRVVSRGPYRWVRHPSYTGLLLILAGYGLARANWLSLAACLVLPVPAFAWRIRVEETELERVLGDAYRAYAAGTARLLPRVW